MGSREALAWSQRQPPRYSPPERSEYMKLYDIYDYIWIYSRHHNISKTITKILATRDVRLYDVIWHYMTFIWSYHIKDNHQDPRHERGQNIWSITITWSYYVITWICQRDWQSKNLIGNSNHKFTQPKHCLEKGQNMLEVIWSEEG